MQPSESQMQMNKSNSNMALLQMNDPNKIKAILFEQLELEFPKKIDILYMMA